MIIKKQIKEKEIIEKIKEEKPKKEVNSAILDLKNIDFESRKERRRGDRRRGYRRIDDRNLISRAQEEANALKENAIKEGFKDGITQANQAIEEFRFLVTNFFDVRKQVMDYLAPNILDISLDIAKKVIKRELNEDKDVVLNNIEEVLKTFAKDEPKINIMVNPAQVGLVKENIETFAQRLGCEAKINVLEADSVEEGGCKFYMNNGIVDATISSQIDIIQKALRDI